MSKTARPASAAVRELVRNLKPGLELKPAGKGFAIVNGDGEEVRWPDTGMPYRLPNTPGDLTAIREQLSTLNVLVENGEKSRGESEGDPELREEQAQRRITQEERAKLDKHLRDRLAPLFKPIGGWDRVRPVDLGRILMRLSPEWTTNRHSAENLAGQWLRGAPVFGNMIDPLTTLAEVLEDSADPRTEWFDLVRETIGLKAVDLAPGQEWPFEITLIPLADMFADDRYQRPADPAFVRELTLKFDERLVGTIDVSARKDGRYAILDGLQRYEAITQVGKTAAWAAVYQGLSVPDEAKFFFHKNRDRKTMHPYYNFRARLVAGDEHMREMNKVVEGFGFKLAIGGIPDDAITSIVGVEEVFNYSSEYRDDCLTPTLGLIKNLWYGRKDAKNGVLLRGVGRFYRAYPDAEIVQPHFDELVAGLGPTLLLGRARDLYTTGTGGGGGKGAANAFARVLVGIHNTGLSRGQRLDITRLDHPYAATRKKK